MRQVPKEAIDQHEILVEPDLSYVEHPLKILDQKERKTRRATVKMYKVQWDHHNEEEATWETEHYLNHNFPGFQNSTSGTHTVHTHTLSEYRDEILVKGVGCDSPR